MDGTKSQLEQVRELFAKAGVSPVVQHRFDPASRWKELVPGTELTTTYRVQPPLGVGGAFALLKEFEIGMVRADGAALLTVSATRKQHRQIVDIFRTLSLSKDPADGSLPQVNRYEFKETSPDEARQDLLKQLPQAQAKVLGKYLAVFGAKDELTDVAKVIARVASDAKRHPVTLGGLAPTRIRGVDLTPPVFVTAKLSVDGKSVAVSHANSSEEPHSDIQGPSSIRRDEGQ